MIIWLLIYRPKTNRIVASSAGGSAVAKESKIPISYQLVDKDKNVWDNPTMKVLVDNKRRVTMPKGVAPGDVFEVMKESVNRFVLIRLEIPKKQVPFRAKKPFDMSRLKGVNLDEPAFPPINDESIN